MLGQNGQVADLPQTDSTLIAAAVDGLDGEALEWSRAGHRDEKGRRLRVTFDRRP